MVHAIANKNRFTHITVLLNLVKGDKEIPIKIKNYNANGTINTMQPTVQQNLIPEMITVRILTNHVISVRMELSNEVHVHVQLIAVSSINYVPT